MWGSGEVQREFLYVDDLAEACLFLLENYDEALHINLGSYEEITIGDLAKLVAKTVGYEGKITHDFSKPDGTPRKKSNLCRIKKLGWSAKTPLNEGLPIAYQCFLESHSLLQKGL